MEFEIFVVEQSDESKLFLGSKRKIVLSHAPRFVYSLAKEQRNFQLFNITSCELCVLSKISMK